MFFRSGFIISLFAIIIFRATLFADPDSLYVALQNAPNDSMRVEALWSLAKYFNSIYPEKSLKYGNLALETSRENDKEAWMAQSYNIIGIAYDMKGDYNDALENYFESLKINEELENKKEIGKNLNNIGVVYDLQKNYEYALEYYFKSLEIKEELNDSKGIAFSYINISNIYLENEDFDKAAEYLNIALKIAEKNKDNVSISRIYNNIGRLYAEKKNYIMAKDFFIKSLELKKQLNDHFGVLSGLQNISECYLKAEYYQNALEFYNQTIDLAAEIGSKYDLKIAYKDLSVLFEKTGDKAEAVKNFKKYLCYSDSLLDEKKQNLTSELRIRHETDMKEKEIEILNDEKQLSALKLEKEKIRSEKQQIYLWSVAVGTGLFIGLVIALYLLYRRKKEINNKLVIQKKEIIKQKNEIEIRKNEIEKQRDEIELQHDHALLQKNNINNRKEKIIESINYAARLQKAMLRPDDSFKSILPESFVFFRPRDMVSGDFYWSEKHRNKIFIAAADCTGHGVPGAFISMLGISFLNQIITKHNDFSASSILNQMRDFIISSLHQSAIYDEGKQMVVKDGMDISLCIIDKEKKQLEFAGANNPLYLVRKKELTEIKGDKMPVGIYYSEIPESFNNHIIECKTGDTFYIFSDGYADQFGGPSGKKLKNVLFKEILLRQSEQDMMTQKYSINQELDSWMNYNEKKHDQVDDILVIGFRF